MSWSCKFDEYQNEYNKYEWFTYFIIQKDFLTAVTYIYVRKVGIFLKSNMYLIIIIYIIQDYGIKLFLILFEFI